MAAVLDVVSRTGMNIQKLKLFIRSWARPNVYALRYDEEGHVVGVWRSNNPAKGYPASVPRARVVPTNFYGWLRGKRRFREYVAQERAKASGMSNVQELRARVEELEATKAKAIKIIKRYSLLTRLRFASGKRARNRDE